MSCSSNASWPLDVIAKAPGPPGFARPNVPSLAAIFAGIGRGPALSLRSQSRSSAVGFESTIIQRHGMGCDLTPLAFPCLELRDSVAPWLYLRGSDTSP